MPSALWAAPDIVSSIKYKNLVAAIDWLTQVFQFRERRGSPRAHARRAKARRGESSMSVLLPCLVSPLSPSSTFNIQFAP